MDQRGRVAPGRPQGGWDIASEGRGRSASPYRFSSQPSDKPAVWSLQAHAHPRTLSPTFPKACWAPAMPSLGSKVCSLGKTPQTSQSRGQSMLASRGQQMPPAIEATPWEWRRSRPRGLQAFTT